MNTVLKLDKQRYPSGGHMPKVQYFYRKTQSASFMPIKLIYKVLFRYFKNKNHVELSEKVIIGEGLYMGHPYCITINPGAVLGRNINIHKGVTIGQENRGKRKGTPVIGDNVWIGINSTIVGQIHIGNDVLIAPNSYVNCDIPDHSVVLGSPCIIIPKEFATEGYLSRTV